MDVAAGKRNLRGSTRERALAGFAHVLTEVPWAVNDDDIAHLRKSGIADDAIEQTILVTAFFNYFPRVADGTGIELDYESPLPRVVVDSTRAALPRLAAEDWNPFVNGSTLPIFPHAPQVTAMLEPWQVLHMKRDQPLGQTTRQHVARVVAEELCDSAALTHWQDVQPMDDAENHLVAFARKLTRTPWAMNANDVETLRVVSLSDEEILGAITLTAYQNAISRMHHGLAAIRMSPAS